MSKIIGIDLGTTNSCVFVLEGETPRVIENLNGGRTTPSVVAYKDNEVIVGDAAKRQAVTNPKNTLFAIKRLIGRKYDDPEVQKELNSSPYKIIRHSNGDAWVEINGKPVSPQEVSSEILKALKKQAEAFLGEKVDRAVITVPAYFNDSQRQATKDAGTLAGLKVERIINEPTSAAVAYGEDKKKEGKIAVYDLGGGTFDVSIIEIEDAGGDKTIEVLSTNGDTKLGGEDFDNVLINYVVEEFKKEQGVDLFADPMAKQRIKEACEKAKIELSSLLETEINLPYVTADATGPKHLFMKLSRAKFEGLVMNLVKRSLEPCKKALDDANLEPSDITEVVLVGGMTRVPLVQKEVAAFFGKEPRKDVNPDEAVAMGAAIQGGVLTGQKTDLLLLDVTPLSLGLEIVGGIMDVLIPRNSTIPTKVSRVYSTAEDNQMSVSVQVYQGERKEAKHNQLLDRFSLENIPPAKRGEPQIEVTFDINVDGILTVSAKEKSTGKSADLTIRSNSGLSEQELKNIIREAELNKEKDEARVKLIQERNNAEYVLTSLFKDKPLSDYPQNVKDAYTAVQDEIRTGENAQTLSDKVIHLRELVANVQRGSHTESQTTSNTTEEPKKDDVVIDAEFEEKK